MSAIASPDIAAITDRSTPTSMSALTVRTYGPPSNLRMETIPVPEIGAKEVLVKVAGAAIDRGTLHLLDPSAYMIRLAFGLRRPRNPVPGLDLAGTVVAVGRDVTRITVGDAVFGIGRGTLAEFAAASEDKLALKPAGMSFEQAGVVPISGLTAIQAVRDAGKLQPGQSVLVLGASGGVGSYAVQIATALGGVVTAATNPGKLAFVQSLGADEVLDYTATDPFDGTARYDLILDLGGNRSTKTMRRALKPHGTLVFVGAALTNRWTGGMHRPMLAAMGSRFGSQKMVMFVSKETNVDLIPLAGMITGGKLTPRIDRVVPLSGVAEALADLKSGAVCGKVGVTIGNRA